MNLESRKSSFTLIELLVIIAIIGILAGFIIVSMSGASDAANDSRRKADINQLSKAVMIWKTNNPDSLLPIEDCAIGGGTTPCSSTVLSALGNASVLRDPNSTQHYSYSSIDGNHYTISAKLSDSNQYSFDSSTGKYGISIPSGEWVDTGLGFQVMKYEARKVDGKASSIPEGLPWRSITQTQAILECNKIGAHLITNAEWTALARHIAAQSSNWSTGVVGSGFLSRGYAANAGYDDSFTNTKHAQTTGTENDLYNTGADTVGPSGEFRYKRTHNLSNGQVLWDFSGNAHEWVSGTCSPGSGMCKWYDLGSWLSWTDSNLNDYEIGLAGPNPSYSSVYNTGRYYKCTNEGNGIIRGGVYNYGLNAGIFSIQMNTTTSYSDSLLSFRCAR